MLSSLYKAVVHLLNIMCDYLFLSSSSKKEDIKTTYQIGQEIYETYIQYKRQQKINNLIGVCDTDIDTWLDEHKDIIVEQPTINGQKRYKIILPISKITI